jgi:hypothetical protein
VISIIFLGCAKGYSWKRAKRRDRNPAHRFKENRMNIKTLTKGLTLGIAILICLMAIGCSGTHGMPNQHDMDMRLIRAAEAGRVEEMKVLLRRGANINATDSEGWTPYLAASTMGRLDAMRILKALGAKILVDEGALAMQ